MSISRNAGDPFLSEVKRLDRESCPGHEGKNEAPQATVNVQWKIVLGCQLDGWCGLWCCGGIDI